MIQGKARGQPYEGQMCMLRTLAAMCKRLKTNFRGTKFACKEEGPGPPAMGGEVHYQKNCSRKKKQPGAALFALGRSCG